VRKASPDSGAEVYVVVDDPHLCRALASLLSSRGWRAVVFRSELDFLREHDPHRPGCLILNDPMPVLEGLQVYSTLRQRGAVRPTILISSHATIPHTVRAMRAGVIDVLVKPLQEHVLLGAVREALRIDAEERGDRAHRMEILSRVAALTSREREVLKWVAAGALNKQIAARLGIVEKTIKAHRGSAMRKLRVRSVPELVTLGVAFGGGGATLQALYERADEHAVPLAIWNWSIATDSVKGNRELATLFGIPAAALGGAPLAEFLSRIHPGESTEVSELIAESMHSGRAYEVTYRVVRDDGSERSVVARGRAIRNERGERSNFPGVAIEIAHIERSRDAVARRSEPCRDVSIHQPSH